MARLNSGLMALSPFCQQPDAACACVFRSGGENLALFFTACGSIRCLLTVVWKNVRYSTAAG